MMEVVVTGAREKGYEPDTWFSPDSTNQKGRPYPYMIFRNMEALDVSDVHRVLKIGDTTADIKEGKSAGVFTAGVIIGSSQMGLSKEEFEALTEEEKRVRCQAVKESFLKAGADNVFLTLNEMVEFIA